MLSISDIKSHMESEAAELATCYRNNPSEENQWRLAEVIGLMSRFGFEIKPEWTPWMEETVKSDEPMPAMFDEFLAKE